MYYFVLSTRAIFLKFESTHDSFSPSLILTSPNQAKLRKLASTSTFHRRIIFKVRVKILYCQHNLTCTLACSSYIEIRHRFMTRLLQPTTHYLSSHLSFYLLRKAKRNHGQYETINNNTTCHTHELIHGRRKIYIYISIQGEAENKWT